MKRRILRSILVITTISVVLFGVPLAMAISRLYRQQAVLELERMATRALPELPEDIARGENELDPPDVVAHSVLGFYDESGNLVVGTGRSHIHVAEPRHSSWPVIEALHGRVSDADIHGWIVTAVPVTSGENVVGAIRAAMPMRLVAARVDRTWFGMLALALGIITIAGVVSNLVSRRLMEPLDAIRGAADRLGEGDFSVRTPSVGVAEVDALGEVLNSTAQRLGDLVARERAFSSDASHQLRTPLTGLRLRLERSLVDPSDHLDATRDAIELVDGLCETVEQLLALARDLPVARGELDVSELLRDAADAVRPALAERGRSVVVTVDSHLPPVHASTSAIRQVLDVLTNNALIHGDGLVRLQARDTGAGVAIEVSDHGPGVDGDIQRIFQRRLGSTNGGHGIGLALARSLADAEGGRLTLQRSGRHPTFVLMLLARSDEHANAA